MRIPALFITCLLSFTASAQSIPLETRDRLEQAAQHLASIWGDTILEGDFYADDIVQLDQVQTAIDEQGKSYYRITYSSKAWDTSTCRFDYLDLTTLQNCTEGRIVEVGFVSIDLKKAAQDRNNRASFIAN